MSRIRRINVPDYDDDPTKVIDVKSLIISSTEHKWTAPANGYVVTWLLSGSDNATDVIINDITVAYVRASDRYGDSCIPGPIPVAKGDEIKFASPSDLSSAKFYPCK